MASRPCSASPQTRNLGCESNPKVACSTHAGATRLVYKPANSPRAGKALSSVSGLSTCTFGRFWLTFTLYLSRYIVIDGLQVYRPVCFSSRMLHRL
jgi:hypothetical protein